MKSAPEDFRGCSLCIGFWFGRAAAKRKQLICEGGGTNRCAFPCYHQRNTYVQSAYVLERSMISPCVMGDSTYVPMQYLQQLLCRDGLYVYIPLGTLHTYRYRDACSAALLQYGAPMYSHTGMKKHMQSLPRVKIEPVLRSYLSSRVDTNIAHSPAAVVSNGCTSAGLE